MTDDFHLFGDPSDGNDPIDPDVALVTAYLARELSPMQVLALEERLATDTTFRAEMQPLIDAWSAPVPSLEAGRARRAASLSSIERAESWRRFQSEGMPVSPTEPIPLAEAPVRTPRRISMKRVALLTAAIALPMVSFAQVVVYAANHDGAPGHAMARKVVLAFSHKADGEPARSDSANPLTSELTDGRVPRPLNAAKVTAVESVKSAEPAPAVAPTAVAPAPRIPSLPNRALIAELIRQHEAALIRGDASAEYVVMVLDASDSYVWSTIGSGNLGIEVAADPRSLRERAAFTLENRDEFWGDSLTRAVGRGRGMIGGLGIAAVGRGRGDVSMQPDSFAGPRGGGRGFGGRAAIPSESNSRIVGPAGGGRFGTRIARGDTVFTLRYDSLFFLYTDARGIVGRGGANVDSLRGFGGGRGRGDFVRPEATSSPGGYRAGWTNAAGASMNRAFGLEIPSADRSGVQGLAPLFVESAETYFFAPRELSSSHLRVMVVHLTPGATWRGPS
jgi:hypothetical protein